MARNKRSQEFIVTPLSSPELENVHGKPSAKRVNDAAQELLSQMGGTEAVENVRKMRVRSDAEKHLAKLGNRTLAKEVTLSEKNDVENLGIEGFLEGLDTTFVDHLSTEVKEKSGVDLRDFPPAVLEPFLALIAEASHTYITLEQEHKSLVYKTVLPPPAQAA